MGVPATEPALPSVLIVEDDKFLREILVYELRKRGYGAGSAESGEAALEELRRTPHDAVLLDVKLPGIGGVETLRRIRAQGGAPEVVLMTAFATLDSAIEATRHGAAGYLKKPIDYAELERLLRSAHEKRQTARRAAALGHYIERNSLFPDFVGDSRAIADLVAMVRKVGPSDCTVLVEGETGTGKELVARNIHKGSRRAALPFVSINCASLPEGLLESELFGHEKGAFTGATQAKPGLLEVADGGTLFLDEIGEMGGALQAKLLRVLENGEVRHVGGNTSRRVDVRVVAATHRDMAREVSEGRFREDLY
ncbi:MAG: sigma-54-dependent Fis family transcriptional regulator, partial [Planctomycetes bacterium]|nr:sigma-54-dependent Fis family transcriptional regulator [Planctomycetota bacterium]